MSNHEDLSNPKSLSAHWHTESQHSEWTQSSGRQGQPPPRAASLRLGLLGTGIRGRPESSSSPAESHHTLEANNPSTGVAYQAFILQFLTVTKNCNYVTKVILWLRHLKKTENNYSRKTSSISTKERSLWARTELGLRPPLGLSMGMACLCQGVSLGKQRHTRTMAACSTVMKVWEMC